MTPNLNFKFTFWYNQSTTSKLIVQSNRTVIFIKFKAMRSKISLTKVSLTMSGRLDLAHTLKKFDPMMGIGMGPHLSLNFI